MSEFDPAIRYNNRGQRVKDAQYTLAGHNRFKRNFRPGAVDGVWGRQAMAAADEARYELGYPLKECTTGGFGQKLYDFLRSDGQHKKLPADYLVRRTRRHGTKLFRRVPLPGHVHYPNAWYPPTRYKWGLQPWIVPQVEVLCKHFGLSVTSGHGGHPPHAPYSDHAWSGAVDLAGPYQHMVDITFWADQYMSGFYRPGKVFRWVGGPAHDANGVEPGHYNHFHGSWYRLGPATSIFNTPRFRTAG